VSEGALATSGLAHDADDPTGIELEAHVIQGPEPTGAHLVVDGEIRDAEEWLR
jgi:hypothetical protein